jgi:hypothetical protein
MLRNPLLRAGRRRARVGIGPATVSVPGLQRAIAAGTSLDVGDVGPRGSRAAGADVGSLATGPFVGAYELAAGIVSGGDPDPGTGGCSGWGRASRSRRTTRSVIRSEVVRGAPAAHAADVRAGVGGVGRIGGALARGAGSTAGGCGARGALARAGSTVRPPLAFSEDAATGGVVQRTYSKDLSRKAVQVMQDRAREPLRREDGTVVTVRQRGREVPVLKATQRERERMGKRRATSSPAARTPLSAWPATRRAGRSR